VKNAKKALARQIERADRIAEQRPDDPALSEIRKILRETASVLDAGGNAGSARRGDGRSGAPAAHSD
jgi:hypothetical protein